MEKHYIGATELLEDSFKLAWEVYESGYRPNYIVGVWRGGAPIGIAVQELFDVLGVNSDHIAIRTSYYSGMGQRNDSVQVYGLSYLIKKLIIYIFHFSAKEIIENKPELKELLDKITPKL